MLLGYKETCQRLSVLLHVRWSLTPFVPSSEAPLVKMVKVRPSSSEASVAQWLERHTLNTKGTGSNHGSRQTSIDSMQSIAIKRAVQASTPCPLIALHMSA